MPKNPSLEPLRIGIDARLAYRRGVGTYVANLIRSLSLIDSQNDYFLFNAPGPLRQLVENPRFHWVNAPFLNAVLYEQVFLPRAAKRRQLHLIHYVDNSGPLGGGLPFVLTLHDTMFARPLRDVRSHPTLRQRFLHSYKKCVIPPSVRKARAILTVSDFSKKGILAELGVGPGKVWVTPEGVDLQEFKGTRGKRSVPPRILVQGASDERKNLRNVFKAARLLAERGKDFKLTVIGMDERERRGTPYLREVREMGLEEKVEWAGYVPEGKLASLYSQSGVFLYPSRWEGFGLPLLEALACGAPVVASNASAIPEVVGDAALLVSPDDPREMADAVARVLEESPLREKLIRRGFERVQGFTWERTARLTLDVYQKAGASGEDENL